MPAVRTPASMRRSAPSGARPTHSLAFHGLRSTPSELLVRSSTRSSSPRPTASRSAAVICSFTWVRSRTLAVPFSADRSSWSTVFPPSMKCAGASMWVPVWAPMRQRLTLDGSPAVRDSTISISGRRPQCSIPGWMGTDTSMALAKFRIMFMLCSYWMRISWKWIQ